MATDNKLMFIVVHIFSVKRERGRCVGPFLNEAEAQAWIDDGWLIEDEEAMIWKVYKPDTPENEMEHH